MTKDVSLRSKIPQDLLANGISFHSLKELQLKLGNVFPANTLKYFVILLFYEEVTLEVEKVKFNVKPNQLVFIGPNKNIQLIDKMSMNNFIIGFTDKFYEKSSNDVLILNSNLFLNDKNTITILENGLSFDSFHTRLLNQLQNIKAKNTMLYFALAHNLIEQLILNGLFQLEYKPKIKTKNINSLKIANQFRIFLHNNITKEKSVQYYADCLNITTRKLTEICEEIFGKTAKDIILDKIVFETTLLIKNSDLTISEIAYKLGYSDDANFSKLIKKHSGKTPKQLRFENIEL